LIQLTIFLQKPTGVPDKVRPLTDANTKPQGSGKNQMSYCIRFDGDCSKCSSWNEFIEECNQDEDLGCTGHGDESYSDADPGL